MREMPSATSSKISVVTGVALAAMTGQIGLPGGGVGYGYASLGGVGAPINLAKSPALPQLRKPLESFIPVARISDKTMTGRRVITLKTIVKKGDCR